MLKWTAVGTVLQVAMVLPDHLFGPVGVAISLVVGLLWAREGARGFGHGAAGGAIVGGACALLGIVVSFLLGDVAAVILAFGTISSAVTGALGGLVGAKLGAGGAGRAPEGEGA